MAELMSPLASKKLINPFHKLFLSQQGFCHALRLHKNEILRQNYRHHSHFVTIYVSQCSFEVNANMSGSAFTDVSMSKFRMTNGDMTDARMESTDVSKASFVGCDLSDVTFENCNLTGLAINSCQVSGVTIDGIPLSELLEKYYK